MEIGTTNTAGVNNWSWRATSNIEQLNANLDRPLHNPFQASVQPATELAEVGDTVKCINVSPVENQRVGPSRLILNQEYTVEDVIDHQDRKNYILRECPNGPIGYRSARFELTSTPNY